MSGRGFQSMFMVGAVASAALGCYLVSLRVASERAALEGVETKIVLAQRDIRLLETEIGTRGRLAQLERWNVRAVQLSAPTADQFVETGFQLATLVKPEARPTIGAPVVLAAAPASVSPAPAVAAASSVDDRSSVAEPVAGGRSASDMMHVASYQRPTAKVVLTASSARIAVLPAAPSLVAKAATKPKAAASVAPTMKAFKSASADPLSPLPGAMRKAKSGAAGPSKAKPAATNKPTPKDSGTP